MKTIFQLAVLIGAIVGTTFSTPAQTPVPPPAPDYQPLNGADIDKLLGPIALYPDPLIAQILPAATLPTQIVLADRYITSGGDPNQIDQQPWDPSVKALARYPTVLKYLDDNLNWTAALGQTFLYQQDDVMNSIQRLRTEAQNYGNLQSTSQQQVIDDSGNIEIVPADPDVIYVPEYNPDVIYYQNAFGPPFITFGIGWGIGGWLNCDFDWHHRHLIEWPHDHPRPSGWWHERGDRHAAAIDNGGRDWHPSSRPGRAGYHGVDRGWNNPVVTRPNPINPREVPNAHDGRANETHSPTPSHPEPFIPRQPIENQHPTPTPDLPRQTPFIAPQKPFIAPQQPFAAPQQRFVAPRASGNDAFIGIQSPQDTRAYSTRGAQSVQSIPHFTPPVEHSAPAPAPAPHFSAPSGGGGGGNGGGGGGHHH